MWKLHWQFHLVNCRSNSKAVLAFLRPWQNLVTLGKLQALRHQNKKQLSVNIFVKVSFPWGVGEMVGRQTRGMGCLPYSAGAHWNHLTLWTLLSHCLQLTAFMCCWTLYVPSWGIHVSFTAPQPGCALERVSDSVLVWDMSVCQLSSCTLQLGRSHRVSICPEAVQL